MSRWQREDRGSIPRGSTNGSVVQREDTAIALPELEFDSPRIHD